MRLCGRNDQSASQGDLVILSKETYIDVKAYTRNTPAAALRIKTKPLYCQPDQLGMHTTLCGRHGPGTASKQ